MRRLLSISLPAAMLAAAMLATPAAAQNLRIGMQGAPTTLDPHWLLSLVNTSHMRNIYDSLTIRDTELRVQPHLAQSWRLVDPTTWEFVLREGVRFHDGSLLTSEDVVASLRRVPNVPGNPNPYSVFMAGITGFEAVDARTIRIRTNGPLPSLPGNLAQIFIVSAAHAAKGNAEFNTGEAAIGTGPFRLGSWATNQPLVLRRHDGYWGGQVPWAQVSFTPITNDTARVAALLAGDVDFVNAVPQQDAPRIQGDRRVALFNSPSAYAINIYPDIERMNQAGVTDAQGNAMAANPFADVRVRRALSIAINRQGIATQIMEGLADPSIQPVPNFVFGAIPDLAIPQADTAAARALLAEAGYPNGFGLTLYCSTARLPRICQAVAAAWTRAGLRATVELVPAPQFIPRRNRRELGVFLSIFGSLTGDSAYLLSSQLHSPGVVPGMGTLNFTGIAMPALDRRIIDAITIIDDAARARAQAEVLRTAVDQQLIIPVAVFRAVSAGRADLAYASRADEEILAVDIRPR